MVRTCSWAACYHVKEGPAPKGAFDNPWSPEETDDGLAKRGDWVTSNPARLSSEGARLLDVSSLGMHVGVGSSTHNFWIFGRNWPGEMQRFNQACLKFDVANKPGHPRLNIDIDQDLVEFFEGEERIFALAYSGSTKERILSHARNSWREKLDRDMIDSLVEWEWERKRKRLMSKFKDAGLLHLIDKMKEVV